VTTELKRLERRLAVIAQIARVTSASLGLDELMKVTYEAISPFFTHEVFTVLRYHPSEDVLRVLFGLVEGKNSTPTQEVSLDGLSGAVVREDRSICIPDLEKRSSSLPDPIAVGTDTIQGSWLGVPLRIRQQVIGVLSISTPSKHAYHEEDEQLLATVADQLAVAIDNARLFENSRMQAERLALLNRISRVVNAKLDLTDLFEVLYKEIEATFDHDEFFVVLHDQVANELNVLFGVMNGSRLGPARLPFGGLSSLVIGKRETVHVRHFTAEKDNLPVPHMMLGETSVPETWLGVPLVVGERVLGVLCVMKNLPDAYSPAKVKLFETIADQIALAVSNAEQFKSMRDAAERLGIVNRIGRVVGREQDLERLAETVHREIAPVFEADTFYIALHNEAEGTIEFPFMTDEGKRVIIEPIPFGEGLTSTVIRTKKTLHTHNPDEYSNASGEAITYGSEKDPISWLGIPLMIEGRVIGMINVQSYRSNAYSAEQELLLQTIADQIAISFERARLFQAVQRELEERALAEERLEEEKNLLRTIINHIPDFIYAKDLEGRYVVANSAIARFFGFDTPEGILGKTIGDLLPENRSIAYLEEEQQIVAFGKEIVNQEEHVEAPTSGNELWLLVTKMQLVDAHDNPLGIVGIDRDITAKKIAEEEVKRYLDEVEVANEEVKTFAYIVSHDLRAPLVNLKGFSSELKDSMEILAPHLQKLIEGLDESERNDVIMVLDEDIPEALGFIETSVSRMDGFINSVLKLSRIGRRELTRQPVDVTAFAETCRQSLAHQMEEKRVELIVNDLPEVVADPTALEQVIGNLLTNAVNYLEPTRPGHIEIGGEKTPLGTKFWIKDNGRGISRDDEEKVFAPFRRAGKQDVKGEGMGLSYVRTMVRQHGGQIWFESEPDVGTTFFFTIADQQKGRND
jgi:PAS domain S-box-containing protein